MKQKKMSTTDVLKDWFLYLAQDAGVQMIAIIIVGIWMFIIFGWGFFIGVLTGVLTMVFVLFRFRKTMKFLVSLYEETERRKP